MYVSAKQVVEEKGLLWRIKPKFAKEKADAIMSILSTSLLQKMEGIRKVSKYASWFRKGDDNVKYGNRELKGYKKALSDCIAIIKKEGVL